MGVQVGFGESSRLVPVEPVFGPTHRIELRDGPKRESWTAYVFNSSVPLERTGQSVRLTFLTIVSGRFDGCVRLFARQLPG